MGDPTKIKQNGDLKDWGFSNSSDPFSGAASCPGNCHAPSKAVPAFSKNSPFFMADASSMASFKPGFKTSGIHNPVLIQWLEDQKGASSSQKPKTVETSPVVKPTEKPDAETIKKFTDQALQFEKSAEQSGITTEEKLLNLQAALACYQRISDSAKAEKVQKTIRSIYGQEGESLQKEADKAGLTSEGRLKILQGALIQFQGAGDVEKAKAVLEKIKSTYESQGNEMGKAYAQAQLAFLNWDPKGSSEKLDEAIRLYEKIDRTLSQNPETLGLKSEELESIRADLRLKRFAAILKRGEYFASQKKFVEAEKDLFQALKLNPSKPLLQFYLEVGYQSGTFNFGQQEAELFSLKMKEGRQSLRPKTSPCPSCHSTPSDSGAFRPITENSPEFDPLIGQKIKDQEKLKGEGEKRFNEAVALVYAQPANLDERYERDLLVAERLEKYGKPFEAEKIYERIVEERKNATHPKQIIQRSMAQNQLAVFALGRRDTAKARDWVKVSLSGVETLPEGAEKKFLTMQARMMEAESYLAEGNVDRARSLLEEATKIPAGDVGTLQYKMAGKLKVRLAQVYYSKKETFGLGDSLVETIKKNYLPNGDPAHGEMVGDAFFAKALSRIGTGRAREAIDIIREEVQKPFPNCGVARALATDSRFGKFLKESTDAQGNKTWVLKETGEINEADWGEAFKVAIVRSGEGPMERKVAYGAAGGLGVAAALALAPEPVATKVAAVLVGIGVGVGLLWERFVTGSEHSDEIYDAYRTGLSPISNEEYMLGLGLFGLDVACLLTAGLAGQAVKGTVRLGLGWTARQVASPLLRTGIEIYGEDLAIWAGRGFLYASEQTAFAFSSSYLYEAQKSLLLGHEMKWTSREALEWLFMGEFIQAASRTAFLGTAVAKSPFFQRGPLKEIRVDGKVLGKTTSEGLAAKWLVDASAGLSAFYGAKKLASLMKGGTEKDDPQYLEFLFQNLYTMGLLHAGEAAGRKLTGDSVEVLLGRMDKKANKAFAEAKEKLYSDPPEGGGWGLQPAWAGAYNMPSSLDFLGKRRPLLGSGPMMMSSLGPFEDKLMEKDIWGIENDHAANPEQVTVKVDVEKASDVDIVIEAANGHLPKEVKRLEVTTPESPDLAAVLKMIEMSRKMGVEILLIEKNSGRQVKISGESVQIPSSEGALPLALEGMKAKAEFKIMNLDGRVLAELQKDRIRLDFKATPVERLDALQIFASAAIRAGRTLDIEFKGETWKVQSSGSGITVRVPEGGTLRYISEQGGPTPRRAQLNLEVTPDAPLEKKVALIRMASDLDSALFKGARIELKGIPSALPGSLKNAVAVLLRQALWSGCEMFEMGRDISVRRAAKGGSFEYDFSSSASFDKVWVPFSEYLAYETARGLGIRGVQEARYEELVKFFRAASAQASSLKHHAQGEKELEYSPFVEGKWQVLWQAGLARIIDFAKTTKNRDQLLRIFDKVRDSSQKKSGEFLEFGPFDGLAFADNAFELTRIFIGAECDKGLDLAGILQDVSNVLGVDGKVELYGAGVGIVFKARIPVDYVGGQPKYDSAAVNELDRFFEMKKQVKALNGPYRLTVIPEDRLQGSNYKTSTFTKTPEWVLEKLRADGSVEKMVTVEAKNQDAKAANAAKIQDMIQKATYQALDHQFNSSLNQGDSLIILKFWDSKGLEGDMVADVQAALSKEYQERKQRRKETPMQRVRVQLLFEHTGQKPSTAWLEFDGSGQWKLRSFDNKQFFDGTEWPEPLPKAMGL